MGQGCKAEGFSNSWILCGGAVGLHKFHEYSKFGDALANIWWVPE